MAKQEKNLRREKESLGVALVGLGKYSEKQLAPALGETTRCHLAGVVSGHLEKCEAWQVKYNLKDKSLYSYERFDEISNNDDIDIVYVVLPNAMHAEYVIRAAAAGKHVICEKPMATTVEDCRRMIDACRKAGVRLSMGYRLHFDPFHREMIRLGQEAAMGEVKKIIARHSMDAGTRNQWRLDGELSGGGPLMDVGVYCVQAAIYTLGKLPLAVRARFQPATNPAKFDEVEEGIEWEMEFPGGVTAVCDSNYVAPASMLRAETEKGWFALEPSYDYNGLKGKTSEGPMRLTPLNQQAAQMDAFARCILNDEESTVPGEMGMRDVEILMAIYESARSGQKVQLRLDAYAHLTEY